MLGLFLGAGFSRWAAGLPLAPDLFDFNVRVRGDREAARVMSARTEWERWVAENPFGLAEQFIAYALTLPDARRKRIIWYVTRRLSDPFLCRIYGGTATFSIDDSRARTTEGVVRAQKVLHQFLGHDVAGVVTANYDLIPEYALTTQYFNYGVPGEQLYGRGKNPWFPWQGSHPKLLGHLQLAKLHGSVSWDAKTHYTDGRCGLSGNALIVPPSPEKVPPPDLEETWKIAAAILRRTKRLVVFGFGFNPYDEALLDLLRQNGTGIGEVLLVDTAPQPTAASALWPHAEIVITEPPDADGRFKRWFGAERGSGGSS